MSIDQVSPKYARALCAVALERKQLDVVGNELAAIAGLLNANDEIAGVFYNPGISAKAKVALFDAVFKECTDTVRSFLKVLAEKRREDCFRDIIRLFSKYADDKRNILSGQLLVVGKITDRQVDEIAAKIESRIGKKVILEQIEDSSIIGGFALKINDVRYDGTIRRRLNEISTLMSANNGREPDEVCSGK